MDPSSYTTNYQQYLQNTNLTLDQLTSARITEMLAQTNWEEPQSPLDCNNCAVMALIEAENSDDRPTREMYLEGAIAALTSGMEHHPLCAAHLAVVQSLIGAEEASQTAFTVFTTVLHPIHSASAAIAPGLVYLPSAWQRDLEFPYQQLNEILNAEDGYHQCLLLTGEILRRSPLVFYNPSGLRFLQLAAQLFPRSTTVNHQLGISSLVNEQWEGLLYLHRANQLLPTHPTVLQALYLAYRDLNQDELATTWLDAAQALCPPNSKAPRWYWATLPVSSPITCVPFEHDLLLAVKPSFRSIITSVLLAAGDWFETEMEFWRDQIQPGMTVIDVGANVGVYTFSAARRVGASGRVIAIEPFSKCIECLQATCQMNQLDWVTVRWGAASDRNGTAQLALYAASELNQLVTDKLDPPLPPGAVEEVPCFTLDTLIERENLQQVDLLKIDAEGHELQVLAGSDRLLSQFAPIILYENIAGSQGTNLPVANVLITKGYQLFRYQPYLKQLVRIKSLDDLQGSLNIIALPENKIPTTRS
ncbi:MAG: FkbM family methyltransferase [Leptolyngbyaceae cyanobacterium RU_5_1]|nr:FkbM family methyltransferase [Leptolyngbyaceae cyanobacterium RU_5_1]